MFVSVKWVARLAATATICSVAVLAPPAFAQEEKKPNILFIMGDDIGWMPPSIYHRGLMVGETPNIDRIGHEGAMFTDYVAPPSLPSIMRLGSLGSIQSQ